jgi:hypothetical protein
MPARRRPAPHAGKTPLRLIVLRTRVGTPNPARCRRPAQHFSCDRDGMLRTAAAGPACSRRNPYRLRLKSVLDLPDRCRCASGTQTEGGNRAQRRFRGEFLPVRSSGRETAPTFLAAWHMSVRVSSYSPRRQQGSDAETDFRRAAPAAANRQVEHALNRNGLPRSGRRQPLVAAVWF